MQITLRDITQHNLRDVINLEVAEHQRGFVAPNVRSIAEAWVYRDWEPMAIYADETPVGFVMCGQDPDTPGTSIWYVIRYMIGAQHQNKGYGKAALPEVLRMLSAKPGCTEIQLGVEPENTVAKKLYTDNGFAFTGLIEHGEEFWAYKVK
jgi:diamine N-acetyltransferase